LYLDTALQTSKSAVGNKAHPKTRKKMAEDHTTSAADNTAKRRTLQRHKKMREQKKKKMKSRAETKRKQSLGKLLTKKN